jgi:ribonuclease P protein component
LRRPGDYDSVLSGGKRFSETGLTAVVKTGSAPAPRLGLAISSRVARDAVDRNRIKRLARESFRRHRAALPNADIVILARAGAADARSADLRAMLERLWQRIRGA